MNTSSGMVPGVLGGIQQQQQQQQQGVVVPKFMDDAVRQNVVLRLEEAMRSSGKTTQKTGLDLEQTIFNKTAGPEAYHNMVERCILKLREPPQQRQQQLQQQQIQQQMQPQQLMPQQNVVYSDQLQLQQQQQQDPNSGSGNMMPQHPVPQQQLPIGQQQQQQQQMRMPVSQQQQQQMMMNQQNSMSTAGQMMRPIMNPGQGGSQLQQRLTGGGVSGNPPRMSAVGPQMMAAGGGVQRIGMNNMMNQRMMGPMPGGMAGSSAAAVGGVAVAGGVPANNLAVAGSGGMMTSRGPPPMYMNPSPHMVQGGSPANMGMMGHSPMNSQYIHSPASQPNASMPSPAGPRTPISNVNTPQTNEQPASQEDQQYLEKVKQLGKYIVPLKKMIDSSVDQANLEKMTRLMEILSNPNKKKMPMETLMRCETVLMKIIPPDSISDAMPMLMDAINSLRASAKSQPGSLNHVLQKTLGAPLEAIYGSEISLPPLPKKKKIDHGHSQGSEIPDVIQGEIARLRSQFKVNLDPSQPSQKSNIIHLTCQLEDPNLPSVPPIAVTLPPSYPETSPICDAEMTEYYSTPFLGKVQEALTARLGKMPARFTLSQLLSAWEMSVRAACSPKSIQQLAGQLTVS